VKAVNILAIFVGAQAAQQALRAAPLCSLLLQWTIYLTAQGFHHQHEWDLVAFTVHYECNPIASQERSSTIIQSENAIHWS